MNTLLVFERKRIVGKDEVFVTQAYELKANRRDFVELLTAEVQSATGRAAGASLMENKAAVQEMRDDLRRRRDLATTPCAELDSVGDIQRCLPCRASAVAEHGHSVAVRGQAGVPPGIGICSHAGRRTGHRRQTHIRLRRDLAPGPSAFGSLIARPYPARLR